MVVSSLNPVEVKEALLAYHTHVRSSIACLSIKGLASLVLCIRILEDSLPEYNYEGF